MFKLKKRPPLTEDLIESAINYFRNISAYDALECMCTVMRAGEAQVQLNGTFTCRLNELLDAPDVYMGEDAQGVDLMFYGGPPNRCELFSGNLFLLFIDHFLFAYALKQEQIICKALQYESQ